MQAFGATPAMTATAVRHKFKILFQVLQFADEQDAVLHMHVIIDHTMYDLYHAFVFISMSHYITALVPLRIIGRCAHKTFGVMRVVQGPVGNTAAGHTMCKYIAAIGQC